ncbi:hypothetical protein ACSBR1_038620 [Camellia fascicularis]
MLKKNSKPTGMSPPVKPTRGSGSGSSEAAAGWEVRPGGMLVQKRNSDQNNASLQIPKIKVRVKFGSSYHELNISPQASFGDLKKMLAKPTGLHPQDQKLIYRDRERDSKVFLDVAGVNDGSKIELIEGVMSRERRVLESRRNDKMDKASKSIAEIGLVVDNLAKQVANLETEIYGGKKVAETVLLNLIELLMTQLLKLDEIVADGGAKQQRRDQVRRVQKYIEILDVLKNKNGGNADKAPLSQQKQKHYARTKWERFESDMAAPPPPPFTSSSSVDQFQFPFGNLSFRTPQFEYSQKHA